MLANRNGFQEALKFGRDVLGGNNKMIKIDLKEQPFSHSFLNMCLGSLS